MAKKARNEDGLADSGEAQVQETVNNGSLMGKDNVEILHKQLLERHTDGEEGAEWVSHYEMNSLVAQKLVVAGNDGALRLKGNEAVKMYVRT